MLTLPDHHKPAVVYLPQLAAWHDSCHIGAELQRSIEQLKVDSTL
jgi:hypothetical protein